MTLFHSDRELFPFQAEHVERAHGHDSVLMNWDCGVGKSVGALALAAQKLDEGLVDHVLLVCEKSKTIQEEWPAEIERYTDIEWKPYAGTPAKRKKIREDLPPMLLASFDIVKNDCAITRKTSRGNKAAPVVGPLTEALAGKRIFVIYDETSRLANRNSDTHRHHALLLDVLRQTPGTCVLALTATPMEKDPVSFYNLTRIMSPDSTCTVREFEQTYIAAYDTFGNPSRFRNLRPMDCPPGVVSLRDRMGALVLRKRKSDPDVVEYFPLRREMPPTMVRMDDMQKMFYETVAGMTQGLSDWEARPYTTVLRQIAGNPEALLLSQGEISQSIVDVVTPDGIKAIGSAKTDRMLSWVDEVVREQGAQAVIFTFFGQSMLPLIQRNLEEAGYSVSINHGGLSDTAKNQNQRNFRDGQTEIFLTSDAGSKGLNLPEASYILHYERPLTHSNFIQRSDRIHRINSLHESVYIYSFVMLDTIEEGLMKLNLRRNDWSDTLLGDDEVSNEDFLSAEDRRLLLKIGRRQAGG